MHLTNNLYFLIVDTSEHYIKTHSFGDNPVPTDRSQADAVR